MENKKYNCVRYGLDFPITSVIETHSASSHDSSGHQTDSCGNVKAYWYDG